MSEAIGQGDGLARSAPLPARRDFSKLPAYVEPPRALVVRAKANWATILALPAVMLATAASFGAYFWLNAPVTPAYAAEPAPASRPPTEARPIMATNVPLPTPVSGTLPNHPIVHGKAQPPTHDRAALPSARRRIAPH